MVLDLTRRLAQANPEMQDPAAEAEAVVLIDEIELHLHPAMAAADRQKPRQDIPEMPVHRDDPFAAGDWRGGARPASRSSPTVKVYSPLPFLRRRFQSGAGRDHGRGRRERRTVKDAALERYPVCSETADTTTPARTVGRTLKPVGGERPRGDAHADSCWTS